MNIIMIIDMIFIQIQLKGPFDNVSSYWYKYQISTKRISTFWLFFTTHSKITIYRIYAYSPLILGVGGMQIFHSNVFFVDAFYFI